MSKRFPKSPKLMDVLMLLGLLVFVFVVMYLYWRRQIKANPQLGTTPMKVQQTTTGTVTNQWYSSLFFADWSNNMFALPLAFNVSAKGIAISYPQVHATADTVFAPFTQDLLVGLPGTTFHKDVLNSDPASVALQYCGDRSCLQTRLVHGSPIINFAASEDLKVELSAPSRTTVVTNGHGSEIAFLNYSYLVAIVRNQQLIPLTLDPALKNWTVPLQKNDQLVIGLQTTEKTLQLADLTTFVIGTSFTYQSQVPNLQSAITYQTNNNNQPMVGLLPHQWQSLTTPPVGTYQTLRGTMKLYRTASIIEDLQAPKILSISDMASSLSPANQQQLQTLLSQAAIEVDRETPITGVYDGGKQVFRIAQLFQIAEAVKSPTVDIFKKQLVHLLTPWLAHEPGSVGSLLQATDQPKGINAKNPQYGSELFSDHHFDYGYYLASAGILFQADPSYIPTFKPGLNALVNDVANTDVKNGFPYLRGFDAYEAHSWADGRGLFNDGNNQESTSEAINRWYGIYELGLGMKQTELTTLGQVGLALEQNAASIYWLGQNPTLYAFPTGYNHSMASLVWGGKVDFATWFSNKKSNIFGIQFLPITPAMTHVSNPAAWQKYSEYQLSTEPTAWNDIYNMVAVTNGQMVPDQLPAYEPGNSAPFYFLWVNYWIQQPHR